MKFGETLVVVLVAVLVPLATARAAADELSIRVEAEEDVYTYEPADNGAGPMWCYGNTCIVRVGDDLFASGLETIADAKPLNNCIPTLFH